MDRVDFVVNCFERNYRKVLAPGFAANLRRNQRRDFAEVTVLVNNVDDRAAAETMATDRVRDGEISRFAVVADRLDHALDRVGLRRRHLRRLVHYSDWAFVAVTLDGPEWVVHWDPDLILRRPVDWVTPTLAALSDHPRAVVGNPDSALPGLLERESFRRVSDDVVEGFGFSDPVFLVRRAGFCAPIYRKWAPASWRYPLAPVDPIFEQWVDAWMRRSRRTRLTYLAAVAENTRPEGGYPRHDRRAALRGRAQRVIGRVAERIDDPAFRAWNE